jgi:ribonuclease HII
MILGIDEVGRGPWAGPLVIGAVVLGGAEIPGLTDSKKLSKKKREQLDIMIREQAAGFGLGWVWPEEIDKIGLSASLKLATIRAVEQIKTSYHEIIIDGTINFLAETNKGQFVKTMPKADLLIPSVSAASIIAKVARDNYMTEQHQKFPEYRFDQHVGYGTSAHIKAIEKHGITPLHRLSFAPIKRFISDDSGIKTAKMIGNSAEDVAAKYLKKRGHKIIDRNWKNKFCEIDIISKFDNRIYFNEVKYRKNEKFGGGVSAIGDKKLKQMKFAAEYYIATNNIDSDVILTGLIISGEPPRVDDFLEIV